MTTKVLGTIQGCQILIHTDGHISFIADCDVDCDGSGGNPDGDPYFQPDTSYHHNGKALNAYQESFIVVPPAIVNGVPGVVLGCQARITFRDTGKRYDALTGDIGPTSKVGEASVYACQKVGIPHNPVSGGVSDFRLVMFELWPGVPAVVDGIHYPLQPS